MGAPTALQGRYEHTQPKSERLIAATNTPYEGDKKRYCRLRHTLRTTVRKTKFQRSETVPPRCGGGREVYVCGSAGGETWFSRFRFL